MNRLVSKKPGQLAQIQFDSGERIFISLSQEGIRISKLWFGFIPATKIFDRSRKDMAALDRALMTFMKWETGARGGSLLDVISSRVMKECRSIEDLKRLVRDV